MIVRLVYESVGSYKLLCQDGTIQDISDDDVILTVLSLQEYCNATGKDGRWDTFASDMGKYPAQEIAYLTTWQQTCISATDWVKNLYIEARAKLNKYVSVVEYAKLHNKSAERVKVLCREGRIAGAFKNGKVWFVPSDASYPMDARRKSDEDIFPIQVEEE